MSDRPPERWHLIIDVPSNGPPPAVTVRRLLKHLWRTWGIRCRGYSEDRRIFELIAENERLREIIAGAGRTEGMT